MKRVLVCFSFGFMMFFAPESPAQTNDLRNTVLHVTVTYQDYDPSLPWRKLQPGMRHGYAVVVDDTHVVTTESLVRRATLIELQRAESGEKMPATVDMQDDQVNLALLKISKPSSVPSSHEKKTPDERARLANEDRRAPLAVTDRIPRKSSLTIVQFDETGQIQKGNAEVMQVYVGNLPGAMYNSLIFKVLTEVNINGEGAPALRDGKLAGLILSYDRSTRMGELLPCYVLDRFLKDVAQTPYEGFASAGFTWTSLVDPAKRAYLNVQEPGKGILVLSVLPGAGTTDMLKPNDVILNWDGYAIDNLGFYEDPEFERLSMPYLIKGRHKPGDVVPIRIVRDRNLTTIKVQLRRMRDEASLIPENVAGEPDDYLVEGGLVFRELTGGYLRVHGTAWKEMLDSRIVHLYMTRRFAPEQAGDRIVILSIVLPDVINIGYQHLHGVVVSTINGQPVRNMKDVFAILDKDGCIERVGIKSVGVDLVLDRSELPTANQRLARLYRVPQLRRQSSK